MAIYILYHFYREVIFHFPYKKLPLAQVLGKPLRSIHNLPRGWAMMILRGGGVTLFPYYDLGGAVENFQRKLHRA